MADKRVNFILSAVDMTGSGLQSARTKLDSMTRSVFNLRSALGAIGTGLFAREVLQAGVAAERMTNALRAATGSSEGAGREMGFVRSEAERLGLALESAAGDYTMLAASSKGTRLEGAATRDIFTAVAEASTVLGLSSETTSGALLAVSQMISKGKVSAEELRGQLGERLPGAFQAAARAMNVTTGELDKMLSGGKLMAEDFLPKFAVEIRKTYAEALPQAVGSAQASLNRFQTQMFDMKVQFAQSGGMDAILTVMGSLNTLMKDPAFQASIRGIARGFADMAGEGQVLSTALAGVSWVVQRLALGFAVLNGAVKTLDATWGDMKFFGLDQARKNLELQIRNMESRLAKKDSPLTNFFSVFKEDRPALQAAIEEARIKLEGVNQALAKMGGDTTGLQTFQAELAKIEDMLLAMNQPGSTTLPQVVLPPVSGGGGGGGGGAAGGGGGASAAGGRDWFDEYLIEQNRKRIEAEVAAGEQIKDLWQVQLEDRAMVLDAQRDIEAQQIAEREALEMQHLSNMHSMRMNNYNMAVGLVRLFAGKNKAAAIAAIALEKGLDIATTWMGTVTGGMLAYASQLVPGDPTSIARAEAARAYVLTQGKIAMGLIAATALGQGYQATQDGGSYSGGGTWDSPIVTQPTGNQQPQQSTVIIQVDGDVLDLDQWIETKGATAIRKAVGRDVNFGLEVRR